MVNRQLSPSRREKEDALSLSLSLSNSVWPRQGCDEKESEMALRQLVLIWRRGSRRNNQGVCFCEGEREVGIEGGILLVFSLSSTLPFSLIAERVLRYLDLEILRQDLSWFLLHSLRFDRVLHASHGDGQTQEALSSLERKQCSFFFFFFFGVSPFSLSKFDRFIYFLSFNWSTRSWNSLNFIFNWD